MNYISPIEVCRKVIDGLYSGIETVELDNLASQICAMKGTVHPDYDILAARIFVSNLHKQTQKDFSRVVKDLYNNYSDKGDERVHTPIVNKRIYDVVCKHADELNSMFLYDRDFDLTFFGLKTLERAYLLRKNNVVVERPQHLFMRVAVAIHGEDLGRVRETYESMSGKYFVHATPTLFNAGTIREGLSSCFLIAATKEDDSIENIYKLLSEAAVISKYSGGIGISIHDVRAKGSLIHSTNGKSEGIIPMLGVYNKSALYVTQASKRPGSIAIYLEPWHSEIEAFLELKDPNGAEEFRARDLFYALWINDLFMLRVKNNEDWSLMCPNECPGLSELYGDEFNKKYTEYEAQGKYKKKIKAQDLFYKIMTSQIKTGVPYMCYKDHVNKKNNQSNLGTIRSSNLCVAPETRILTSTGYHCIKDLVGTRIKVWNGSEFSETMVQKTNDDEELIKIEFSNGSVLECTRYHKFYIKEKGKVVVKDAQELKEDDKLIKCDYPIVDSVDEFEYAYTCGFFSGDGKYNITKDEMRQCKYKKKNGDYCMRHQTFNSQNVDMDENYCKAIVNCQIPMIALYDEKKELVDYIEKRNKFDNNNTTVCMLPFDISEKFKVPINYNVNSKLRFFEGLCDSDGTSLISENDTTSIQIGSINKTFLEDVKLMLQTLSIDPKVQSLSLLPNGKGDLEMYNSKEIWRLLLTSRQVLELQKLGFSPKRLQLSSIVSRNETRRCIKVKSIEYTGRRDETFCFNEPMKHKGIFNGILAGNCTEIMEYSDSKETAVCNLASLGLPAYVKKGVFDFNLLHEKTKIVTRNLDNIIDITFYPGDKAKNSNLKHRPIGIGISGLADVFSLMKYPFDSSEARQLNKDIFETIYHGAMEASCDLSKERGRYKSYEGSEISKGLFQWDLWGCVEHSGMWDWEKLRQDILENGVRNSLVTAVMPTASTSQILGNSECIEPLNSNIYKRQTLSGEYQLVNKYLLRDLCREGIWCDDLKDKIIKNKGSVQEVYEIPKSIRDLYKIAWDISPKVLINLSADRAPYVDQSQSLNIFLSSPTFETLSKVHFYGWEKGLKTGMYYLRARAASSAIQFSVNSSQQKQKEEAILVCTREDQSCTSCSA